MYPSINNPALARTVAAMMTEEAIANAQRRREAQLAREARHTAHRRAARSRDGSLRAVAAAGAVAAVAFGSAWAVTTHVLDDNGSPTGQHPTTLVQAKTHITPNLVGPYKTHI